MTDEQIQALIDELQGRLKQAQLQEQQMHEALTLVRDLCDHDYKEIGHDHNYVYYKCSICGKNIKV